MSDIPERCPVHNVFHPKGPLCDPTQTDTANPWVEAVLESMDDIRIEEVSVVAEPPHEEWKITSVRQVDYIPVTLETGVLVGRASIDTEGHLHITLSDDTVGRALHKVLIGDALRGISLGTSVVRPKDE